MSAVALQTVPRPPAVAGGQRPSVGQRKVANDEVMAILQGLQLDKKFFQEKLQPEILEDLRPLLPENAHGCEESEADSRFQKRRNSMEMLSPEGLQKRLEKEMLKAKHLSVDAAGEEPAQRKGDVDVYLGKALLPVLAQSLDSLCRQLNRMEEEKEGMDPLVQKRFNPLTFLAQQLLRRHPSCARTPRRQALYKDFEDWSDAEQGRREMLRRKDKIQKIFNGFLLKGTVHCSTLPKVISAIDDTLRLKGALKLSAEVQSAFAGSAALGEQQREAWNFSQFWHRLAKLLLAHDLVPFSAIAQGAEAQAQELRSRLEREEAAKEREERRRREAAERRKSAESYEGLRERLLADGDLQALLTESKILTGDELRPGDLGFENEVPPKGKHVSLLAELLELLGFEFKQRGQRQEGEEEWWNDELADAWTVLQSMNGASLTDGVVERETLEKVLVPPEGFLLLKSRVEDELERREGDEGTRPPQSRRVSGSDAVARKASMQTLCERFAMTTDRMTFLHELFEKHLGDQPAASLRKQRMRALVCEVNPNVSEAEFEARYRRADREASGEVGFEEFVSWVHSDEAQFAGPAKKLSVAELAQAYGEPVLVIQRLHSRFKECMPSGVVDKYPERPASLEKEQVFALLDELSATELRREELEADWQLVDASERGGLDFDEFLEMLDFGGMLAEIREGCESTP